MKKTLMCALLAFSLVGTKLCAYDLSYNITPNRYACFLDKMGGKSEQINDKVAEIKKDGFFLETKRGKEQFNFKSNPFGSDSFVNSDGIPATFNDLLSSLDGNPSKEKKAIADATDMCASVYAATGKVG
jgi:hypothetical protein